MKDNANNTVRKTNKHTNLANIEIYILHVCKYMIWYMPYGLLNVILTKLNIIQPKLLADVNLARRYWFVWIYQLKFKNSNECLIRIRLNWKYSPRCQYNSEVRRAFGCSGETSSSSSLFLNKVPSTSFQGTYHWLQYHCIETSPRLHSLLHPLVITVINMTINAHFCYSNI